MLQEAFKMNGAVCGLSAFFCSFVTSKKKISKLCQQVLKLAYDSCEF